MNILKKIFADSVVYGLTSYLSVIAAIFLTPIYTRILTKADYGAMDIINTWVMLVVAILPLGLMNAILRFYPDIKDDPLKRKNYLSAIVLILLANSIFFLVLSLPFYKGFTTEFIGSPNYVLSCVLAMFVAAITPLYTYNLQLLRVKLRKWSYLTITVTNFLLLSVLGFVLVYYYKFGIEGFFIASLIGLSTGTLLGFIFNQESFSLKIKRSVFYELLKYSIHFLSVFILMQMTLVIDRYLINEYFSLELNGIYAIAIRIGGIAALVIGAFSMAWMPYVFNIYKNENAPRIFEKVFNLYLVVTCFLLIALMTFRTELIWFFAPDYTQAYFIAAFLAIFHVISGFTTVLTIGVQISKKTQILSIAAAVSITVNVISSIILLNYFGIEGVAIGSILGAIVWIGIQTYFSQKYYPIRINWLFVLIFVSIVIATLLITNSFFGAVSLKTFILKVGTLAVIGIIMFAIAKNQFKNLQLPKL